MKMLTQLAVLAAVGWVGIHSVAAETPSPQPNSNAAFRATTAVPANNVAAKVGAAPSAMPSAATKHSAMPSNAVNAAGAKKAALSNVAASGTGAAAQKPPSNAVAARKLPSAEITRTKQSWSNWWSDLWSE